MTNPGDPTALLSRLDGELADLGARLARVRSDLGVLRGTPFPTTGALAPAAVPGPGPAPAPPSTAAPPSVPPSAPPAGLPAGVAPWAPSGPVRVPPSGPPVPPPPSGTAVWAPPPAAPRVPLRSRLPRLSGARLLAATGTGVTLLGVVLLLVLAASRGWFGAEARVGFGALVGLGLLGAGIVLQRRRADEGAGEGAADPGPVSLAATGLTALYLTVAAAASLYDLLPSVVAVVLALGVAGGGLLLADRWRRRDLALGVVVGADLLVPLVTESAGPLLVALLVVVVAVALPVAARRAWPVLVAVSVGFAALSALVAAGAVGVAGSSPLGVALAVGALLAVGVVAALVLVAAPGADRTATLVAGIAIAAPVLPLIAVAPSLDRPWGAALDVVAVLLLLAAGAVAERGTGRVPATPALVATAVAAAGVLGLQAIPLALTGAAAGGGLLAVAAVLGVLAARTGRTVVLAVAGAFGVLGGVVALVRDLPLDVVVGGDVRPAGALLAMAAVGVLLAAAAGSLLVAVARADLLGGRDRTAVVVGLLGVVGLYGAAGVVVTLALAVAPDRGGFLVGHVLVTISWTALALVLLVRGVGAVLPRVLGGVLVVAAVAKLILFDLVALDGLARVVVFLGAGLVLLAAGTRYARLVTTAAEEPGTLAPHGGDAAQRSSTRSGRGDD
ncbi:hypothetical protein GCM10023201_30400 [Actinomycetospora corticicola]|uniref:Putative membrane protein n=1 Tax=Actinomycetospora corticicola TaxID=663602 RepID=A0A7Y9DU53_9PSEU|nr:DUF2339 domain-containing protein [Actinomycetospora corticicola]NYD35562.1 putative membrane protein [Actinomycetospora corticicola]